MTVAADGKLGGPFEIDQSVVSRDSMIREDNDGDPINDTAVRDFVKKNKDRIFAVQAAFYNELNEKHAELGK